VLVLWSYHQRASTLLQALPPARFG